MSSVIRCQGCEIQVHTDSKYRVFNWPTDGDLTEACQGKCQKCKVSVFAHRMQYNALDCWTAWVQSPSYARKSFLRRIREGFKPGHLELIEGLRKDEKPTRGKQHCSEYTEKIKGSAENTLYYLNKIERAQKISAS